MVGDGLGNKKTEVIYYMLKNSDDRGLFIGSIEDVAKETGVSQRTVCLAINTVSSKGGITKVRNSVYQFSPSWLWFRENVNIDMLRQKGK